MLAWMPDVPCVFGSGTLNAHYDDDYSINRRFYTHFQAFDVVTWTVVIDN